ncbi:glutamate dehydrogenase, putative [Plasmodium gaboni]|uniref:Glutamate dehydrogenase, putative n=1 Tax=Plasmodium gaboni TaxID=647221 RepID=A0ABY1UKR2_9APIC|nr:glutamate dehydrogenase, putative [Plasmodium gaboni]
MDIDRRSALSFSPSNIECGFGSEHFSNNSITWKEKYEQTKELLRSYNLFSDNLINYSIDFYFNKLGFNKFHFEETSPELISKVVVCIITAKINEQYSSDKYFPTFEETHDNVIFIITRVFADDNKTRLNYKMEKKIEEKYFNFSDMSKDCYRLKSFRSVHSVFDKEHTYQEPLRTYILELPTYNDDIIKENETDLKKLMDVNFYNYIKGTRSEQIYYELNKAVLYDLTGQFLQTHYYETSSSTFTLTIAVKRSNVISSIFSLIGDCLNMHRCFSYSKYVEPLKNGVLLIILNVKVIMNEHEQAKQKLDLKDKIYKVVKSLKTLCLFNDSRFIQLSVKRTFTAQESAYLFMMIKFITFFSTNTLSSYKNVEHALNLRNFNNNMMDSSTSSSSTSPSSVLNDFYIIKEKLKSSKYTKEEILRCAQSNVRTIKMLFSNFEKKLNHQRNKSSEMIYDENIMKNSSDMLKEYYSNNNMNDVHHGTLSSLASSTSSAVSLNSFLSGSCDSPNYYHHNKDSKDIIDEIEDNHDKKILQYFYMFEKYALKTNFFLTHKISLAVAFDGALLKDSIYEAQPYSIIMILGLHFVGFHIRFSKISRGGVRIVISNNVNSYMHNSDNLFDEAYNLAYTQNFKNKDIPEGGSKGIILLDADVCNVANTKYIKNLSFYSYVNSILDLLINEDLNEESVSSISVHSTNNVINNTTTSFDNVVNLKENMVGRDVEHLNMTMSYGTNTGCNNIKNNTNLSNMYDTYNLNNSVNNRSVSNSSSNINMYAQKADEDDEEEKNKQNGNTKRNDKNEENGKRDDHMMNGNYNYVNGTTEDAVQKIMSSKCKLEGNNNNNNSNSNNSNSNGNNIIRAEERYNSSGCALNNVKETRKMILQEKMNEEEDLIFLGPDENTGSDQLMDWACIIAKKRRYPYWKTFSTGKLRKNGGVPHDMYGMTTLGIETYISKLCEKLNIKEESISRSVVGGPDGDLGSNAILQSKTKIISIIDGSGVLYDKQGLNKEELIRLAKKRNNKDKSKAITCCTLYDEKYFSKDGFKISIEDHNVDILGTKVRSGLDFRNTFFLNPLNKCELFNPCGGRPHSINIFNVHNIIKNGECIYKYIVEGANVFISDDARNILESKNVILFKDAATNKGGVISSSLEVLAGLVLDDKQYIDYMCSPDSDILQVDENEINFVHQNQRMNHSLSFKRGSMENLEDDDEKNKNIKTSVENKDLHNNNNNNMMDHDVSEFYKAYVKEIQKKITHYCELEFESLWKETRRTKTPISKAINILSNKISELKKDILSSDTLCRDYKLLKKVLEDVIPPTLLNIVTFEQILERVPYVYIKSLFASSLASNYYYSQQFLNDLSAFNFFEYIRKLQSESA